MSYWQADFGNLCVNTAGGSYTLTHIQSGLRRGNAVAAGQVAGTVAPAGSANNNGVAHIHFEFWSSADCYNANVVPFDTAHGTRICGAPDLAPGGSGGNGQWSGTTITASQCGDSNPFGSFDTIDSPAPGQVHVRGWAVDPNSPTTSLDIHVYVGGPAGSAQGAGTDTGPATTSRPDVGAAYPGVGDDHGYDAVVDTHGGTLPVYVYAINAPGTPGDNVLLGEKDVAIADPNPIGSFDGLSSPQGGEVHVSGWDLDPSAPTQSIDFHVYVGGPAGDPNAIGYAFGPANAKRPDVGAAFPGVGDHHGIDASFATTKTGVQPVYLYAIDVGPGDNVLLGSRTVDVGTGPPDIRATARPRVHGTRHVGSTLRGTHGQWSVTGLAFRYRWLRDGRPIKHAMGARYVVRRADRGHHLRVRVAATKTGYISGAARSRSTHRIR